MSAITVLESYDTQMDYSGDFDFAMHTAGSSSDTWPYHSETVMEDAHHDSQSAGAADRESVEVDMEQTYPDHADNKSVEYEMADDGEIYQHEDGDLLDVEVYDASQLQSPVPMPTTIDTPQMTSGELTDFTIRTTPAFTDPLNPVEVSTAPEDRNLLEHSADALQTVETIRDSPPRFEGAKELDPTVAATELSVTASVDLQDHIPVLEREVNAELPESSNDDVIYVEDSRHLHSGEAESTWSHEQDHGAVAHLDQHAAVEHHGSEEYPEQYYEYEETVANVADPHEISEGVYIDPPPAVLLSLPSSDRPEICLFNHPPTRAGSLSPSEETHQQGQQVLTLLLHHRPTLYYEPLTNVFEALRQEELIALIPEFAEGELAMDVYDLQLIVSEDNAHAREVTLHDLNVLHDGSDLSGPLRLRLHVVVPRFILRYHMLRDQIARLNLAVEEEGQQVVTQGDENIVEYRHPEEYQQEAHPVQPDEDQPDQQCNEQTADNTERTADINNEVTGDISNLTAEDHHYHNHHGEGEAVRAPEDEDENANPDTNTGPELDEEDAGENFVVNAIHNSGESVVVVVPTGDTEPREYDDDADALEYNEQYGEALPEHEVDGDGVELDHHTGGDNQESTDVYSENDEALLEPDIIKLVPAVDLGEPTGEQLAEDRYTGDALEETFEEIDETDSEAASHDHPDYDSVDTVTKHSVLGADESDSNLVAVSKCETNLTDPEAEPSVSEPQKPQELELQYPDDDPEWDDDLDAEGEIDATWPVDQDDGISNQSSTTLSSTTSAAKRGYDELDSEDDLDGDGHSIQNSSPEPKRPRVA